MQQHGEFTPGRIRWALERAGQASPGESWQTDTDLRESDQADIYFAKA